ncbi:hypothetical protein N8455_00330 [Candidatus Gracilibacteria bacterium]|nr:hypothetical protein [Candidatus Gracilibacteria bacterium]
MTKSITLVICFIFLTSCATIKVSPTGKLCDTYIPTASVETYKKKEKRVVYVYGASYPSIESETDKQYKDLYKAQTRKPITPSQLAVIKEMVDVKAQQKDLRNLKAALNKVCHK